MIQPATLTHLANIGPLASIRPFANIGPLSTNGLGDWSNFLGPIEGAGAFLAGYVLARKHNCHVKGCWRVGRYPIDGTTYVVCHHHHPRDEKPSHQDVLDAGIAAHRIKTHRAKVAREAEAHWAATDAAPAAPTAAASTTPTTPTVPAVPTPPALPQDDPTDRG